MKKMIPIFIFIAAAAFFIIGCKKDKANNNEEGGTYQLKNDSCTPVIKAKNFKICCDSIFESRCPANAICVWQGYAGAKFSLHQNGQVIPFTLSTLTNRSIINLPNDTVINQIKIILKDITPYPGIPSNTTTQQAVINVTE
jgi:hypothetical protein